MNNSPKQQQQFDNINSDTKWAFERYEQLRSRLPSVAARGSCERKKNLGELVDHFDVFVFDSFGVLNVGEEPIAGVSERIAMLRAAGKTVIVLTNAATAPLASLSDRYHNLGFDFLAEEIVSSRAVLAAELERRQTNGVWLVIAPRSSAVDELGVEYCLLDECGTGTEDLQGVLFISSQTMTEPLYKKLKNILTGNNLPLLVGNPDLVAPRVNGFSREPGFYAHRLADELGITVEFFGKPYQNAFDTVMTGLGANIPAARIVMIGDTLHTDILGGAAAGFGTVLVANYGVLKDLDVAHCIQSSGIAPDYIISSI